MILSWSLTSTPKVLSSAPTGVGTALVDDGDRLFNGQAAGREGLADGGYSFRTNEIDTHGCHALFIGESPGQVVKDHEWLGVGILGRNGLYPGVQVAGVVLHTLFGDHDDDVFDAGGISQDFDAFIDRFGAVLEHIQAGIDEKVGIAAVDDDRMHGIAFVHQRSDIRFAGTGCQIAVEGLQAGRLAGFGKVGIRCVASFGLNGDGGPSPSVIG